MQVPKFFGIALATISTFALISPIFLLLFALR